jgi:hypothetical protein
MNTVTVTISHRGDLAGAGGATLPVGPKKKPRRDAGASEMERVTPTAWGCFLRPVGLVHPTGAKVLYRHVPVPAASMKNWFVSTATSGREGSFTVTTWTWLPTVNSPGAISRPCAK